MQLSVHACTERAAWHTENQDRAVVGRAVLASTTDVEHTTLDLPTVVAVLDGLGGHPAGDVASDLAARILAGADTPTDEAAVTALLDSADQAIHAEARDDPARLGMGTTAALLVPTGEGDAIVANVGDSAVFVLDPDTLTELTLPDRGIGGALTQCLGAYERDPLVPHLRRVGMAVGDRFVLASDGLTDVLADDVIEGALRGDGKEAASTLLSMVDASGPPDDVTIVVVEVIES